VALLRVSEFAVVNNKTNQSVLRYENLYLGEKSIRLYICRSKSDQKRAGTQVDITFDDSNRFCYHHVQIYLKYRPKLTDQLFCHFDGSPLTTYQFNAVLKKALSFAGLRDGYFKSHSFRIGGATCMFKQGYQIHEIKSRGRWRSSAYRSYIRS
jgi:site-specific recombinase XerD